MDASRSDDESLASAGSGRSTKNRYLLADPSAPPPPPRPRGHLPLAILLGVGALLGLVFLRGPLRGGLPFVLIALAAVALVRRRRFSAQHAAQLRPAGRREMRLRSQGIALSHRDGRPASEDLLLDLSGGFGTTLFSSRQRDRAVLAITSQAGTLFVGTSLPPAERRVHAGFLARASVVDGDEMLDAVGPDGRPLELDPADLVALSDDLSGFDPGAGERIVLSDGRGRPLVLDGPSLRVGEHRFDLLAPIEWRAFLFQEPFGGAVTVYQATWIRQGGSSLVLVALVPSIMGHPTPPESTGIAELDRALLRDLRLTHAAAGEPPPQDQRVAVDRLFVLPMRAALDRAPRASSHGSTGHSPGGPSPAGREFPV